MQQTDYEVYDNGELVAHGFIDEETARQWIARTFDSYPNTRKLSLVRVERTETILYSPHRNRSHAN